MIALKTIKFNICKIDKYVQAYTCFEYHTAYNLYHPGDQR